MNEQALQIYLQAHIPKESAACEWKSFRNLTHAVAHRLLLLLGVQVTPHRFPVSWFDTRSRRDAGAPSQSVCVRFVRKSFLAEGSRLAENTIFKGVVSTVRVFRERWNPTKSDVPQPL